MKLTLTDIVKGAIATAVLAPTLAFGQGRNSNNPIFDQIDQQQKAAGVYDNQPLGHAQPLIVDGRQYFAEGNFVQAVWGNYKNGQEILGDDREIIEKYLLNPSDKVRDKVVDDLNFLEFIGLRGYGVKGEKNNLMNPRVLHAVYAGYTEIYGKRSELMSFNLPALNDVLNNKSWYAGRADQFNDKVEKEILTQEPEMHQHFTTGTVPSGQYKGLDWEEITPFTSLDRIAANTRDLVNAENNMTNWVFSLEDSDIEMAHPKIFDILGMVVDSGSDYKQFKNKNRGNQLTSPKDPYMAVRFYYLAEIPMIGGQHHFNASPDFVQQAVDRSEMSLYKSVKPLAYGVNDGPRGSSRNDGSASGNRSRNARKTKYSTGGSGMNNTRVKSSGRTSNFSRGGSSMGQNNLADKIGIGGFYMMGGQGSAAGVSVMTPGLYFPNSNASLSLKVDIPLMNEYKTNGVETNTIFSENDGPFIEIGASNGGTGNDGIGIFQRIEEDIETTTETNFNTKYYGSVSLLANFGSWSAGPRVSFTNRNDKTSITQIINKTEPSYGRDPETGGPDLDNPLQFGNVTDPVTINTLPVDNDNGLKLNTGLGLVYRPSPNLAVTGSVDVLNFEADSNGKMQYTGNKNVSGTIGALFTF